VADWLLRLFPKDIPNTTYLISMSTLLWEEAYKNQKVNGVTVLGLMFRPWYDGKS
jgi:hypothetical protein